MPKYSIFCYFLNPRTLPYPTRQFTSGIHQVAYKTARLPPPSVRETAMGHPSEEELSTSIIYGSL